MAGEMRLHAAFLFVSILFSSSFFRKLLLALYLFFEESSAKYMKNVVFLLRHANGGV